MGRLTGQWGPDDRQRLDLLVDASSVAPKDGGIIGHQAYRQLGSAQS